MASFVIYMPYEIYYIAYDYVSSLELCFTFNIIMDRQLPEGFTKVLLLFGCLPYAVENLFDS